METGVGEHSLTAEDQLFILMQAALYLTATRGMAAPEVLICYERAESIVSFAKSSPAPVCGADRSVALFLLTDKLTATMRIAKRVYSLAQEQNDSALMIGACQRFGGDSLLFGRF